MEHSEAELSLTAADPVVDLGQCVICMSDEQELRSRGKTHRTSLASLFASRATMDRGVEPLHSETIYYDEVVVAQKGEGDEELVDRLIAEATRDRELANRAIRVQCLRAAKLGYTSVLILGGTISAEVPKVIRLHNPAGNALPEPNELNFAYRCSQSV